MIKLQALYNNNANKIVKEAAQGKNVKENLNFLINLAMIAVVTQPIEDEPQAFKKAQSHPNPESRRKWHEAIQKDFRDMNKQQVWREMHKSLMLPIVGV